MPKFEFAIDTERSFYEVEAATEAEARKLLFDSPDEYYRGCHHDMVDDENSYELIDVMDEEEEELLDKADQKHNAQMLDGCETEDEVNAELRAQTQGDS